MCLGMISQLNIDPTIAVISQISSFTRMPFISLHSSAIPQSLIITHTFMLLIFFPFSYIVSHKMCEKEQKQKQPSNGLANWSMDGARIEGNYKMQKLEFLALILCILLTIICGTFLYATFFPANSSNPGPMAEQNNGHLHTEIEAALEKLELKAEIRAENEEQKANYQTLKAELKDELAKMLSTQNEQHQMEMAQLETKCRKLEEKMNSVELQLQTKENGLSGNKILANPKGIVWNGLKTKLSISEYGLKATSTANGESYVYATKGYAISAEQWRKENFPFPGTILFYFEVTLYDNLKSVGLSDGNSGCYTSANSYSIAQNSDNYFYFWLSGKKRKFNPIQVCLPGYVVGCGLLLNSKNALAVFFTVNGQLLEKQIPIHPTVDRLYPTVHLWHTVEANFGDNLVAKPFVFDIDKCPGLVFE